MNINVKLAAGATLPAYQTQGAAAADLYACQPATIEPAERVLIHTGVALELPQGYCALILGRSGKTIKQGLVVATGLLDCDYRGNIGVMAFNLSDETIEIAKGERIGQLLILPHMAATFTQVETLTQTDRGTGGFGSTGK